MSEFAKRWTDGPISDQFPGIELIRSAGDNYARTLVVEGQSIPLSSGYNDKVGGRRGRLIVLIAEVQAELDWVAKSDLVALIGEQDDTPPTDDVWEGPNTYFYKREKEKPSGFFDRRQPSELGWLIKPHMPGISTDVAEINLRVAKALDGPTLIEKKSRETGKLTSQNVYRINPWFEQYSE